MTYRSLLIFLLVLPKAFAQTNPDEITAAVGQPVRIPVLLNDIGDWDPKTLVVSTPPQSTRGIAQADPTTGEILYSVSRLSNDFDQFSYQVADMAGNLSDETQVTIVKEFSDRPIQNVPFQVLSTGEPQTVAGSLGPNGFWRLFDSIVDVSLHSLNNELLIFNRSVSDFRKASLSLQDEEGNPILLQKPGARLECSFDFQLRNYLGQEANDYRFRFGFWSVAGLNRGYFARTDLVPKDNTISINRGGTALGGSSDQLAQSEDPKFVPGPETRRYTICLERQDTSIAITVQTGDAVIETIDLATDTNAVFETFDTFGIMVPTDSDDADPQDDNGSLGWISNTEITFHPGFDENLSPTAVDDETVAVQGSSILIDPASNDLDPNFNLDPTTVEILEVPKEGSAAVNPETGEVTYSHAGATTAGSDSFTYRIADLGGLTSEARVQITIEPQTTIKSGTPFSITFEQDNAIPLSIGPNGAWHQTGGTEDAQFSVSTDQLLVTNQSENDFRRFAVNLVLDSGQALDLERPGASLTISLKVKLLDYLGQSEIENDRRFRFGFWNSQDAGKGYFVRADAGLANGVTAGISKNGAFLGGNSSELNGTEDPLFAAENGQTRTYEFELQRFAPDLLILTLKADGRVLEAADRRGPLSFFDTFGFTLPTDLGDPTSTDNNGSRAEISEVTVRYGRAVDGPVAPVAEADSGDLNQGASIDLEILENDFDLNLDLNPSGIAILTEPVEGNLSLNSDTGIITYAHRGGPTTGQDHFTYQLTDEGGNQSEETRVDLTIQALDQSTESSIVPVLDDGTPYQVSSTLGDNGFWRLLGNTADAFLQAETDHVRFENRSTSEDNADDFRRVGLQFASDGGPLSLGPVGSMLEIAFSMNLLDYRPRPTDDVDRRFRFGVWNLEGRGYFARMDVLAGLGSSLDLRDGGSELGGSSLELGRPRIEPGFVLDSEIRRYRLRLQKVDPFNLQVSVSVEANDQTLAHQASDTVSLTNLFDFFGLIVPKDGDGVTGQIRDVEITYLRGESEITPLEFFQEWLRNSSEFPEDQLLPLEDPDGDSFTNLEEYALGGDPIRPALTSLVEITFPGQGNSYQVSFKRRRDWKERGLTYRLETSENLSDWTPFTEFGLVEPLSPTLEQAVVPLDSMARQSYVRLVISLENAE